MFTSKTRPIIAAAALAVGVFGSAQAAHAGAGIPDAPGTHADIIAVLKTDKSAASTRKAGGVKQDFVVMRKAGGDPE